MAWYNYVFYVSTIDYQIILQAVLEGRWEIRDRIFTIRAQELIRTGGRRKGMGKGVGHYVGHCLSFAMTDQTQINR